MTSPRTPSTSSLTRARRSAWLIALITTVVMIGLGALAFRTLLVKPSPPAVDPTPAPVKAQSKHVMLVIVDGLRYDYGTDPSVAPNYARRMRELTHARLIAERVTMTSAAVVAISSGQRGDFAQLITNLDVGRLGYNDFITNAQHAGIKAALVGDDTWRCARGDFDIQLVDAHAMAINVDNSEEMLAKARKVANTEPRPGFMISHFIAPDHQGHAYGTAGEKYHKFFKKFDRDFESFLDSLAPDWTVIVTSDHGQTDTGAHGTDTPIMRQSPMFAYGPGIQPHKDLGDVEQINLGPTMAALLGVPVSTHARATLIYDMLTMSEKDKAAWACAEIDRVGRVSAALPRPELASRIEHLSGSCRTAQIPPAKRIEAGKKVVAAYDLDLNDSNRSAELRTIGLAALFGGLWVWLLLGLWGPRLWPSLASATPKRYPLPLAAAGAVLVGTLITFYRERIPSPWHLVFLGVALVIVHLVMLYATWRPSHSASFYARHPAIALTLFPLVLFISYPANTSPETFVTLLLVSAVLLFAPLADNRRLANLLHGTRQLPWSRVALLAAALALLIPYSFRTHEPSGGRAFLLTLGLVPVVVWLLVGAKQRDQQVRTWELAVAPLLAVAPAIARPLVPASIGVPGVVIFPLAAVVAGLRGRWTLAFGLGFGAYGWLSRDTELLPIALGLIVLESLSHALKASEPSQHAQDRKQAGLWTAALLAGALFAAIFLARYALQGGLDTDNIDYAVGAFGDPNVSQARLGASIVWKYASVYLLMMTTLLLGLPKRFRLPVTTLMVAGVGLRVVNTIIVLFTGRRSYWTAFRTFSDLTPMVLLTLCAVGVLIVLSRRDRGQHPAGKTDIEPDTPTTATPDNAPKTTAAAFVQHSGRPQCAR